MPINYSPLSQKHSQIFQSGLTHLVKMGHIPMDLTLHSNALPVFHIGLREVMSEEWIHLVKHVAWRHFANSDSLDYVVSGELDLCNKPRVTRLSYGHWPREALKAVRASERHQHLKAHDYEVGLLRIPALLFEALWFRPSPYKPSEEEKGWLVPYHTLLGDDVKPDEPYAIKDVFKKLKPLIEKTMAGSMSRHSTAVA